MLSNQAGFQGTLREAPSIIFGQVLLRQPLNMPEEEDVLQPERFTTTCLSRLSKDTLR